MFQVFGVIQKRKICMAARLEMKRDDFDRNMDVIKSLTPKDLMRASTEEARGEAFSNRGIRLLQKHLRSIRSKVMGTDESRISMRGKVWGMTAMIGPPSVWVTINPADV